MANDSTSQAVDDTNLSFMEEGDLRRFLAEKMQLDQDQYAIFFQRASAEINRRFSRKQIRLLEAPGSQLEAQGRQNEAQLEVARSLKRATWWLSGATIVLALATVALVVATVVYHR